MADGANRAHEILMREVVRAFAEGDLRPLHDALDDDVVWTESTPASYVRFGGTRYHRAGVVEAEAHIFAAYVFRRFEPIEIVTSGDVVWGLFRIEATHRPTDKTVKTDYVARWRMRNGKIVEHQGFYDTAAVLMQQGQIPTPAG